jgi:hypothetical protein
MCGGQCFVWIRRLNFSDLREPTLFEDSDDLMVGNLPNRNRTRDPEEAQ